jgi:hypothetical protein
MQLEKKVSVEIETFEGSLSVDIDWDASETIMRPREYVDHWWIVLWDKASSLTSAISLTSSLPKVITWSSRRGPGYQACRLSVMHLSFTLHLSLFSFLAHFHGFLTFTFCHVVIS